MNSGGLRRNGPTFGFIGVNNPQPICRKYVFIDLEVTEFLHRHIVSF